MTLDETMIINNMTNVIKNLEQSKRICDIIDDLNELILTLGGRKHDIIDEPEHVKTETKPERVEHVPVKAATLQTPVHIKTVTMMPATGPPSPPSPPNPPALPATGPPSESKPVQTKAEPVQKKYKGAGAGQWEG